MLACKAQWTKEESVVRFAIRSPEHGVRSGEAVCAVRGAGGGCKRQARMARWRWMVKQIGQSKHLKLQQRDITKDVRKLNGTSKTSS